MIARKVRTHFLPMAAVSAGLLFSTASRGADAVYQFDIPAELLSQSLRDYSQVSTQQLIFSEDLVRGQTAPALHGQFSAAEALDRLLKNSGLMTDRTPSGTVMVKTARRGTGSTPNPIQSAAVPAQQPQQLQHQQSQQPLSHEDITVTGHREGLNLAIRDYVATYTARSPINRVARWDEPICPGVAGLERSKALFVVERVRAIAEKAGVRVNPKEPCTANILIVFSQEPQELVATIRKNAPGLLGYHFYGELNAITAFTHPVQAWYATATRDHTGTAYADSTDDDCPFMSNGARQGTGTPLPPLSQDTSCKNRSGQSSVIRDDLSSVFQAVTVVADTSKITGIELSAVSDYVTMLALSQTKAFDSCSPLPSIRNLFASGCDPALRTTALSESDTAYLDVLYALSPGMVVAAARTEIQDTMLYKLGH